MRNLFIALVVVLIFVAQSFAHGGEWAWRMIRENGQWYWVKAPEQAGYYRRNGVRWCLYFAPNIDTPWTVEYTANNPCVTNAEWFAGAKR